MHYSLGHSTHPVRCEDCTYEQHNFWIEKTLPNGQRFVGEVDSGWCLNCFDNPAPVLDSMLEDPAAWKLEQLIAIRSLAQDKWLQRADLLGGLIVQADAKTNDLFWEEVDPVYGSDVWHQRQCEYHQCLDESIDAAIFG